MSETTLPACTRGGSHTLPAGEDSWSEADCDLLVAAALDGCGPCQDHIGGRITAGMTDPFGRLFTSWVLQTLRLAGRLRATLPPTMADLVAGGLLSGPSMSALRGVRLPRAAAGALQLDAGAAVRTLERMSRADRLLVLGDVLDGIVGEIVGRRGGWN